MIDDTINEEKWSEAAEYALGLLTDVEAKSFEAAMAANSTLRADYAGWAENFVALTDDIAPVTPPTSVMKNIMNQIFETKLTKKPSWIERLGMMPAIGGGLLGAVAVLWVLDLSGMMRWLETPEFTARVAADDSSLIVQASYDADTGVMLINRVAGEARAGRTLELWLVAGEQPPVSLGLLAEGQTVEFVVPADIAANFGGGVLAISDEPPGGSPTGAPTGDVLAVGPIVTL